MYEKLRNLLVCGDALTVLKKLPDSFVQTCITSPPYYKLRDVHDVRQVGQEANLETYIENLVTIFHEVKRVLRDDGTCWIVIGDTYASKATQSIQVKPKDLLLVPFRVALALQVDGWYVRQVNIWNKPNVTPFSGKDRTTTNHEYILFLSKKQRYYYDTEAIKEPAKDWGTRDRSNFRGGVSDALLKHHGLTDANFAERGKNKRSVWTVATKAYKENGSHFAAFPEALIEPMVLAGTSPQACEKCGAPWKRVVEGTMYESTKHKGGYTYKGHPEVGQPSSLPRGPKWNFGYSIGETKGWVPTCQHDNQDGGSCLVLDPFMGIGTTAVVALQHGREYLGIEIKADYMETAQRRIETYFATLHPQENISQNMVV